MARGRPGAMTQGVCGSQPPRLLTGAPWLGATFCQRPRAVAGRSCPRSAKAMLRLGGPRRPTRKRPTPCGRQPACASQKGTGATGEPSPGPAATAVAKAIAPGGADLFPDLRKSGNGLLGQGPRLRTPNQVCAWHPRFSSLLLVPTLRVGKKNAAAPRQEGSRAFPAACRTAAACPSPCGSGGTAGTAIASQASRTAPARRRPLWQRPSHRAAPTYSRICANPEIVHAGRFQPRARAWPARPGATRALHCLCRGQ